MSRKPVVALVLPPTVAAQMFAPADLARLRDRADVRGPVTVADEQPLRAALAEAVAVVTGWGSPRFGPELLAHAPGVGLIAHSAGSVKGVAGEAVFDRGIRVTTAASANATPVAEFTVAMFVMMLKGIPWVTYGFARDGRDVVKQFKVRELRDLSVGLIGASRVGREVVRLLGSYPRVTIKLHDPYVTKAEADALGVELATLDDVCKCEVVSVHAPAIPETRHMINARTLGLMPDHAVFVNTARGSLVDEAALVVECRRRPIWACLDVTDPEPPRPDSPLRTEPRILLTPHIAGAMGQARTDMGRLAIDETLRFLDGQPLTCEVTRAMLATQA